MEKVIAINSTKQNDILSDAGKACRVVNDYILPIARELDFSQLDLCDPDKLAMLIRHPDTLKDDYLASVVGERENRAEMRVIIGSAEAIYSDARGKAKIEPWFASEIQRGTEDFISIQGFSLADFKAVINKAKIEAACRIYATEEVFAKREEIKAVCESLNKAFNGRGDLLFGYIGLVKGRFMPIESIVNFEPLM